MRSPTNNYFRTPNAEFIVFFDDGSVANTALAYKLVTDATRGRILVWREPRNPGPWTKKTGLIGVGPLRKSNEPIGD